MSFALRLFWCMLNQKVRRSSSFPIVLSFRVSVLFKFSGGFISTGYQNFLGFSLISRRGVILIFLTTLLVGAQISLVTLMFLRIWKIYPGLSSLRNRKPLRKIVLTYLYVLTWCDFAEIRTDFSEKLSHCYLWYHKNDVNRLSSNGTHGDAIGLCKVKNYYASRFASVNPY